MPEKISPDNQEPGDVKKAKKELEKAENSKSVINSVLEGLRKLKIPEEKLKEVEEYLYKKCGVKKIYLQ